MATIVAVEDDPAIADLLDMYLRREDHRVYLAADGERGLELIAAHRPDVVILDVGLPGIDGLEVCRRIRELSLRQEELVADRKEDDLLRLLAEKQRLIGMHQAISANFSPLAGLIQLKRLPLLAGTYSPLMKARPSICSAAARCCHWAWVVATGFSLCCVIPASLAWPVVRK